MPSSSSILGLGTLGSLILGTVSDFNNLDFEIGDAQPGRAASWVISSSCADFEVHGFDIDALGFESFEIGWGIVLLAYEPSDFSSADFGTEAALETFDRLWGPFDNAADDYGEKVRASANLPENFGALFAWGAAEAASFPHAGTFESFEVDWSNNNAPFSWSDVTNEAAEFDTVPQAVEDFDNEWNNDNPRLSFEAGPFEEASFQDPNFIPEGFEQVLDGDETFQVVDAITGELYRLHYQTVTFSYEAQGIDTPASIATNLVDAILNSGFQITATVIDTDTILVKNLNTQVQMFMTAEGPNPDAFVRTTPNRQTTQWLMPLLGV